MPEPLSIVASVAALLQATWAVSVALKKFQNNVSAVPQTIQDLQRDVAGFSHVLESMRESFATITAEEQTGTGHLASHWSNISRAIEDGKGVITQLTVELTAISQTRRLLDGPRKQLRLKMSEERLTGLRLHIQFYRDGLHLSLQTIMLSQQISHQKSTDQLLPSLDVLHSEVRRIALGLNEHIETLRKTTGSRQDEVQILAINNLRDCVKTAASIVSSASTIKASESGDSFPTVPLSDFGDCFPVEQNLAIRRWIDSRSLDDETASEAVPRSIAEILALEESEQSSDTESDLDMEIADVLLEAGIQERSVGDSTDAERMFRNCLSRLPTLRTSSRTHHAEKHIVALSHLFDIYQEDQRYAEAKQVLQQRLTIRERLLGRTDVVYVHDVYQLACLLYKQSELIEAQLHARKALKSFKKLQADDAVRQCLALLINVCADSSNHVDKEAYALMLKRMGDHSKDLPSDVVFTSAHPTTPAGSRTMGPSTAPPGSCKGDVHSAPLLELDAPKLSGHYPSGSSEIALLPAPAEDIAATSQALIQEPLSPTDDVSQELSPEGAMNGTTRSGPPIPLQRSFQARQPRSKQSMLASSRVTPVAPGTSDDESTTGSHLLNECHEIADQATPTGAASSIKGSTPIDADWRLANVPSLTYDDSVEHSSSTEVSTALHSPYRSAIALITPDDTVKRPCVDLTTIKTGEAHERQILPSVMEDLASMQSKVDLHLTDPVLKSIGSNVESTTLQYVQDESHASGDGLIADTRSTSRSIPERRWLAPHSNTGSTISDSGSDRSFGRSNGTTCDAASQVSTEATEFSRNNDLSTSIDRVRIEDGLMCSHASPDGRQEHRLDPSNRSRRRSELRIEGEAAFHIGRKKGSITHAAHLPVPPSGSVERWPPVSMAIALVFGVGSHVRYLVQFRFSNGSQAEIARSYDEFHHLKVYVGNKSYKRGELGPGTSSWSPYITNSSAGAVEARRHQIDQGLQELLHLPKHVLGLTSTSNFFDLRPWDRWREGESGKTMYVNPQTYQLCAVQSRTTDGDTTATISSKEQNAKLQSQSQSTPGRALNALLNVPAITSQTAQHELVGSLGMDPDPPKLPIKSRDRMLEKAASAIRSRAGL